MQNGRLGKYEIRGTLGKGAMGTVYDGFDAVIDRRVAIKTMPLPDPTDAEAQDELARFRREAQAAGRLTHPNIVAVYDYGEDDGLAFIVMEYAPGTELKKILDKGDRLPPAESVRIMQGVLAGLQYSHERGVVHRDIKPGNIILAADGTVKIADFGIARIESSQMTQAGTVMGTPAYMSPEQFMGQTVDARTDIYSAGVMLYQLLTGERPFEGSMSAIMHKALNTEPPRPSDLSVTAPPALDPVVARAMAKRPGDRFDTAASFAGGVAAAMAGGGVSRADPLGDASGDDATMIAAPPPRPASVAPKPASVSPPPVAPAKSRAPLFAGVAVAVLAAAGIGGYVMLSGDKAAPPTAVASVPQAAATPSPPQPPVQVAAVAPPAKTDPPAPPSSSGAGSGPGPTPAPVTTSPPPAKSPEPAASAAVAPPVQVSAPIVAPQPPNQATVTPVAPAAPVIAKAPEAPPPPPPPVQTASIAATPAMIRTALDAVLRRADCSLARTSLDGSRVAIAGLVGKAAEPSLQSAVMASLPDGTSAAAYAFRLESFDGPYCDFVNLVRTANARPLSLGLLNNATVLRTDDRIAPQIVMPDFPARLTVDYFSSDGGVTHMRPTQAVPSGVEPPGTRIVIGNSPKETAYAVQPPYGTDMIVAFASSAPLFATPRPDDDTSADYLAALRKALDDAAAKNVRVAAGVILVQTRQK